MKIKNAHKAFIYEEEKLQYHPLYDIIFEEWSKYWLENILKITKTDINCVNYKKILNNKNIHPNVMVDVILKLFFESSIEPNDFVKKDESSLTSFISKKDHVLLLCKNNFCLNKLGHWFFIYQPNITIEYINELKNRKYYGKNENFINKHNKIEKILENINFKDFEKDMENRINNTEKEYILRTKSYKELKGYVNDHHLCCFGCTNIDKILNDKNLKICLHCISQNPSITFDIMQNHPQINWSTRWCDDHKNGWMNCDISGIIINPNMDFNDLQKIVDNEFILEYNPNEKFKKLDFELKDSKINVQKKLNKTELNEDTKDMIFYNKFTLMRVNYIQKRIKEYSNLKKIFNKELIEKTWHPKRFYDWCLSIDEKLD